jgi:hypothetical protein
LDPQCARVLMSYFEKLSNPRRDGTREIGIANAIGAPR